MQRVSTTMQNSSITIETGRQLPTDLVLLERKGLGHPDTLADHLAEELSRAYSRYTLDRFGAVLHHNFDKLALLGGSCEVRYGAGQMTAPVKVLINGRAAYACGGEDIPVRELAEQAIHAFFQARLPELTGHLDLVFNITGNPSPGAVVTDEGGTDRSRWFASRSVDDLRERHVLRASCLSWPGFRASSASGAGGSVAAILHVGLAFCAPAQTGSTTCQDSAISVDMSRQAVGPFTIEVNGPTAQTNPGGGRIRQEGWRPGIPAPVRRARTARTRGSQREPPRRAGPAPPCRPPRRCR